MEGLCGRRTTPTGMFEACVVGDIIWKMPRSGNMVPIAASVMVSVVWAMAW